MTHHKAKILLKLFFNCSILSRINTQTIQLCKKLTDEDTKFQFTRLRKTPLTHPIVISIHTFCNNFCIFFFFILLFIRHNDDERFWSNASVDDWAKEMAGMRIIIEKFANLTDNSVVGVRSPYLRVGGNNQFTMMEEQAFLYDSTITAPLSNPPLWPYTVSFSYSIN